MGDFNELEQAWQELQDVPAYVERFDPHAEARLVVVQHCEDCQCWHDADEGCPSVLVEA